MGGSVYHYHPKRKDFSSLAPWYGCTSVNCQGCWSNGSAPPINCRRCLKKCSYTKLITGPFDYEEGWNVKGNSDKAKGKGRSKGKEGGEEGRKGGGNGYKGGVGHNAVKKEVKRKEPNSATAWKKFSAMYLTVMNEKR